MKKTFLKIIILILFSFCLVPESQAQAQTGKSYNVFVTNRIGEATHIVFLTNRPIEADEWVSVSTTPGRYLNENVTVWYFTNRRDADLIIYYTKFRSQSTLKVYKLGQKHLNIPKRDTFK